MSEEYIKEMVREYGKDSDIYKVRVPGEFPKGGDLNVIFYCQGLYSEILYQGREVEVSTLAGLVCRYEDERKAEAVFVDSTGVGYGLLSNLRTLGRHPISVELGGALTQEGYLNKRAECWGKMKEWLKEGGWLPKNEKLREDLSGPEYSYTLTGKVQLERKERMRSRGLSSPDLGDALALTFACPIIKRSKVEEKKHGGLEEYDPFTW